MGDPQSRLGLAVPLRASRSASVAPGHHPGRVRHSPESRGSTAWASAAPLAPELLRSTNREPSRARWLVHQLQSAVLGAGVSPCEWRCHQIFRFDDVFLLSRAFAVASAFFRFIVTGRQAVASAFLFGHGELFMSSTNRSRPLLWSLLKLVVLTCGVC